MDKKCTACVYHETSLVNCMDGVGPQLADIMFVGQAPGHAEEVFKIPLVGETGLFFEDLLARIGILRGQVRITNAIRCRPTKDKSPAVAQINACRHWLVDEVLQTQPKVIVALGAVALKAILGNDVSVTSFRGRFFVVDNIEGTPLHHPVYVYCMNMPAVVFRRWQEFPTVIEDFDQLGRYLKEGFTEGKLGTYHVVQTVDYACQVFDYLSKQPHVGFDLETTTYTFNDKAKYGWTNILCASFTAEAGVSYVVPWMGQHGSLVWDHSGKDPNRDFNTIFQMMCKFFESDTPKGAQNGIFDIPFLWENNVPFKLSSFQFDTMLAHHTLQENTQHDLDYLLGCFTKIPLYSHKLTEWKKANYHGKSTDFTYAEFPNELLWNYAGADTDAYFQVRTELKRLLETEVTDTKEGLLTVQRPLIHLFDTIVMPLNRTLVKMKKRGMIFDAEMANQIQNDVEAEQTHYTNEFNRLLKEVRGPKADINLRSSQQLGAALFNTLHPPKDPNWDGKDFWGKPWQPGFGMPIIKKTPAGKPAADIEVIEQIDHPAAECLRQTRRCQKKITTYLCGSDRKSGMLGHRNLTTGRVHADFKQHTVVTGRLASEDPALHNIPSGKKEGYEDYEVLRNLFTVPPNWWMIQADYSQLELKIVAGICHEPAMLKAFDDGLDVHIWTASQLFKKPYNEVTKGDRKVAKDINFGLIYGKTVFSLAEDMGISIDEAQAFLDMYFTTFAGLSDYFEASKLSLRTRNFITDPFGRKRRLYGYRYMDYVIQHYAQGNQEFARRCKSTQNEMERQCINFGVQATGHDMMSKYGTVGIDRTFEMYNMQSGLLFDHHDALYAESPPEELYQACLIFTDCMEQPVPELNNQVFSIDLEVGPCWGVTDEVVTQQVQDWVKANRGAIDVYRIDQTVAI